ncbi:MAG: hypothetical protein ACFE7R_05820, partial [Candidatus Hodarchaeota archaeon]
MERSVVMMVPGTTMDISLKTNRIYATDQGINKRIRYAGRSFSDVLEELQRFAYLRGYNTPTSILKFIIKRLGLPDVDVFPSEDELTKDDVLELSRALNVIDTLKDEYLSPSGQAEITEELRNLIILKPDSSEDIKIKLPEKPKPSIWEDVPQSEEAVELIYSFHWENLPVNTPTPRTQASEESGTKKKKFIWDDEGEMESLEDIKPTAERVPELLGDSHELKALFLGEAQVGVKSILFECNLKEAEDLSCVYRDVIENDDNLVGINAWTFEGSQAARIPRQEFYTGTGIAVLVYSVAERWSFDSLDFWVKELTNTFLVPPPIIVVGNKTDLRDHPVYSEEEAFEPPVTTEDGQAFCTKIAKQLGENGTPHPVLFMETSSITGKGISELLTSMVDLWFASERPSMP